MRPEYVERKQTNCEKWDGMERLFSSNDLLPLWVADMDFKVPEAITKALHEYVEMGAYGYYKVPDSYYEAFIAWEKRHHGFTVEREWLRFSLGVVSGFNWGVQMLSEPGDSIMIQQPVYYPFARAIENNERHLVSADLVNHNGHYQVDLEAFEETIIREKVKLFILCSPHNPVGRVWTEAELKGMIALCRKHKVYVLADEIHQDLVMPTYHHTSAFLAEDYREGMILLTAPSKTFNLAAGQNSIIIIKDEELRARWDAFVLSIAIGSGNAFGYIAAEAGYREGDEWLQGVKEQIQENYDYLKVELSLHLPKAVLAPLEGTYLAWLDLGAYLEGKNVTEVMEEQCKLAVDYGNWFAPVGYEKFIRLNLATSLDNIKVATASLCERV
ncbi:cystathionine beta-lyase [Lachnospiraceae bacterium PF1-22]|uniref:MalY/PatB family protein n=1 Tax=Ohessyouella blattaphilus TaxID=2949333 RepID=UPI003E211897